MNARFTLKKNSDFRRLYAKGRQVVNPYMVVYCRKNRNGDNRLGYTVSSKLGHAVVRNRVRRRLREVYRLSSPQLKQGYDLIVVARTRAVGADFRKLQAAFADCCERLGIVAEGQS